MLSTLALLLSLVSSLPQEEGLVLHEPTTGATVTIPDDWNIASGDEGLMAVPEDKRGFVLLAASDDHFDQVREDVKALILERLDDVVVERATAEGVDERGAIEEIVVAAGKGISKLDGEEVQFAGLLVRSGKSGALVLGAWKDEANQEVVAKILDSLHVKQSAGKGGLEITNKATGVSVKIPAGWDLVRSRKGLLTTAPEGKAMAILMGWQGNFEEELKKMRETLLTWVFKEVEIGEFAAVEATYDKSLGLVVAANGKAIDQLDELPVEFTALRIENVDKNQGAALFGAWKDEKHEKLIAELMTSIKVKPIEKKQD